jgi:hypothetical protein
MDIGNRSDDVLLHYISEGFLNVEGAPSRTENVSDGSKNARAFQFLGSRVSAGE